METLNKAVIAYYRTMGCEAVISDTGDVSYRLWKGAWQNGGNVRDWRIANGFIQYVGS
jgi:hypothetical protein